MGKKSATRGRLRVFCRGFFFNKGTFVVFLLDVRGHAKCALCSNNGGSVVGVPLPGRGRPQISYNVCWLVLLTLKTNATNHLCRNVYIRCGEFLQNGSGAFVQSLFS